MNNDQRMQILTFEASRTIRTRSDDFETAMTYNSIPEIPVRLLSIDSIIRFMQKEASIRIKKYNDYTKKTFKQYLCIQIYNKILKNKGKKPKRLHYVKDNKEKVKLSTTMWNHKTIHWASFLFMFQNNNKKFSPAYHAPCLQMHLQWFREDQVAGF